MNYRPRWSILAIGALIVLALFTYPSWHKILNRRSASDPLASASDTQREILSNLAKANKNIPNLAVTMYVGLLTNVPAPTAEQPTPVLENAQPVRNGIFRDVDKLRLTKGTVTLYRSADGSLLLRFDDFTCINGPNLQVYLSGNPAPQTGLDLDISGVSRFPVGPLKGNVGNQQYSIPKELPIQRYQSVVIFSEALQMVYAVAVIN